MTTINRDIAERIVNAVVQESDRLWSDVPTVLSILRFAGNISGGDVLPTRDTGPANAATRALQHIQVETIERIRALLSEAAEPSAGGLLVVHEGDVQSILDRLVAEVMVVNNG